MRNPLFMVFLAIPAAFALAASPAEADDFPPIEVGLLGGLLFPDDDITGHGPDNDDPGIALGVQGTYAFHRHWAAFADGIWSGMDSARPYGDASVTAVRGGLRLFAPALADRLKFFANAGFGWMNVGFDDADSISRPFVSFGFGQHFRATESVALHWELRTDGTFGDIDDDFIRRDFNNAAFLFGASLALGGDTNDSDRDGVADAKDECPDTPRGARVDGKGCPKDSDGDGVYDGLDQCPNTPSGWPVDSKGCPTDGDGDGVADGADRCPDTPRGWPVNASGCPLDTDGDGVADGIDECPNTPAGAQVDDKGCTAVARVFQGATGAKLVLEGVNFEWNSDELTQNSRRILDRVAVSLRQFPDVTVELSGHTDSQGSDEYNRDLSQRRAASVRAYLESLGISRSRMEAMGYGEDTPIADNETEEGRAQNRRVELKKTN